MKVDEYDVRDVFVRILPVSCVDSTIIVSLKLIDVLIVFVPASTGRVTGQRSGA